MPLTSNFPTYIFNTKNLEGGEVKRKININPTARIAYLPKDIIEQGWNEEVDAFANAFTITLIKPGVSLAQAKRSLELVLQDMKMRLEAEKTEKEPQPTKA